MDGSSTSSSKTKLLTQDEFLVVGMGASAGGVEALEAFFSVLPPRPNLAIVVVQHLAPNFESLMPQIIARRTEIPVSSAVDGDVIKPNHIYVLPAGKEIILSGSTLRLKDRPAKSSGTSTIDQFFRSLAQDFRHRAVAVVLSGTGSDGSTGVMDVHEAGGYVIVQSENSAKFNGMPRAATDSGIADAVVAVDEIPDVLERLNNYLRTTDSQNVVVEEFDDHVGQILSQLRKRFAIDFSQYKGSMIKRRIERRLMLSGDNHANIKDYLNGLDQNPDELNRLFSDLLIGVTEFFRDASAFEVLRQSVLPDLLMAKAESGVFRAWVAPTATGEEAYSLAMLVDECMQEFGLELEVKIFATDAHKRSIDVASRGEYPPSSIANVTADRVKHYFRESGDGFHVCRHIRKMVVFAEHNVLLDAPFTALDLVCCRNLLIYLKPPAQKKILSLFNFALNDAGVLFLGPSETIGDLANEFQVTNEKWRFYRKIGNAKPSHLNIQMSTPRNLARPRVEFERDDSNVLVDTYAQLIDQFIGPSLLVNELSEIVHVFAGASKFLSIREGRPTKDVLQMLPDSFRIAVANGMKRCKDEKEQIVYAGLQCEIAGEAKVYRVTIHPIAGRKSGRMNFLISFDDSDITLPDPEVTVLDSDMASVERVSTLEEELRDTRQSLHASIGELKSANEEMQSTNEELIASNEELQSTNEELHSVNEELYTVNSEHQRKITELTELTDDMENLLDSIRVDTIFLDRHLKLRKFTLGIARTFRLIPQDVGRKIDSFNHDLMHDDLVSDIQSVLDSEEVLEKEVQNTSDGWFLMRLLPYTSRGRVDGVLLTLIDISPIKATEQKLAELSEIVDVSDDAIFRVDNDAIIRTWNRGARAIYGYDADQVLGKSINTLLHPDDRNEVLEETIRQSTSESPLCHLYMKHSHRNSKAIDVAITVSPIVTLAGESNGASIVIRDISTQKRAQEEVQKAVQRRDEFLAMLSHELRNPLAAILNADSLLRETGIDNETASEAREVAETQLRHLTGLLDDLLDVARITNDKMTLHCEVMDLRKSMMEATECVQHRLDEKSQQLYVDAPDEPMYVDGDIGRLQQAQVNLLVNASKYTPVGGKVHYTLAKDGDHALLTVVDDGIGVSTELSQSIFDLFVQSEQALDRSQGGMGLGLPLVKMIAEAHNGSVSLSSEGQDCGSTFKLRLPLSSDTPAVAKVPQPHLLDGRRLLLIEDNAGIRRMLARSLQLKGLEIADAADAKEGLEKLREFKPEIAVVDIGLPDIDGYEVAKLVRKSEVGKDILLVAVTGYGRAEDREKALASGFNAHMVKPVDPNELVENLGMLCAQRDGVGESV
ncbi:chemotaxis protein CheB [Planctomycetes bacterium K23_9]|uniref:histidine kinase n=1 Tax=Stieleria marina TaxID=1930275 RepID=A0A517NWT5_9BACT|nr:Alkaline phosphatase synthesis sensor protein PhoR [Planctomycetes bacterium K23_9]